MCFTIHCKQVTHDTTKSEMLEVLALLSQNLSGGNWRWFYTRMRGKCSHPARNIPQK